MQAQMSKKFAQQAILENKENIDIEKIEAETS